jgi:hypothetical protein
MTAGDRIVDFASLDSIDSLHLLYNVLLLHLERLYTVHW